MDDTIATELKFIDDELNEFNFELVGEENSAPFTACQITSAVETVGCIMTKKIRYSSNNFEFDIIKSYTQLEVPGGNPALNRINYAIELMIESRHIIAPILDLFSGIDTINRLTPMDQYSFANQEHMNVAGVKIDSMIVYDSFETLDVEFVDAELQEVIFQIPNGIVGLTLKNETKLILVE